MTACASAYRFLQVPLDSAEPPTSSSVTTKFSILSWVLTQPPVGPVSTGCWTGKETEWRLLGRFKSPPASKFCVQKCTSQHRSDWGCFSCFIETDHQNSHLSAETRMKDRVWLQMLNVFTLLGTQVLSGYLTIPITITHGYIKQRLCFGGVLAVKAQLMLGYIYIYILEMCCCPNHIF